MAYLPPVSSPITARALARGAIAALVGERDGDRHLRAGARVAQAVQARCRARTVVLTNSGTAALTIALRAVVKKGRTVAIPAYGCVDLIAATVRAQVRVRLYDVEPSTLGPDLDSLRRALRRGADAVVVAHFYGYPADIVGARAVAESEGAVVIEDAAQQAGATLGGAPLGATGPVSVLSFGRGKGTTGGRGGAVLATATADADAVAAIDAWRSRSDFSSGRAGWGDWGRAAAQWVFGRPSAYALPASIPGLGIGETVYRPAGEPQRLSRAAAAIVEPALARIDADRAVRARRAIWYAERLANVEGVRLVEPIVGAEPGYLRFPILDGVVGGASRASAPRCGVVRSYPRPLGEEPSIASVIQPGEPIMPGAQELCERLFTLPTHADVSDADGERVVGWAKDTL